MSPKEHLILRSYIYAREAMRVGVVAFKSGIVSAPAFQTSFVNKSRRSWVLEASGYNSAETTKYFRSDSERKTPAYYGDEKCTHCSGSADNFRSSVERQCDTAKQLNRQYLPIALGEGQAIGASPAKVVGSFKDFGCVMR